MEKTDISTEKDAAAAVKAEESAEETGTSGSKRSRRSNSLASRIFWAKIAVKNASANPIISESLLQFGYDEDKFKEGIAIVEAAEKLHSKQKAQYAARTGRRHMLHRRTRELRDYYIKYLGIARVFLRYDDGAASLLGLKGRRAKSYARLTGQAERFFKNALHPDIMPVFAEYNIPESAFRKGLELVTSVQKELAGHKNAYGVAQQTTLNRDEAVFKMEFWVRTMITFAKAALGKDSQLLESLGVLVRTPK